MLRPALCILPRLRYFKSGKTDDHTLKTLLDGRAGEEGKRTTFEVEVAKEVRRRSRLDPARSASHISYA